MAKELTLNLIEFTSISIEKKEDGSALEAQKKKADFGKGPALGKGSQPGTAYCD